MKRLPLITSFLLFVLLCMSLSYWGMHLLKPKVRPVALPPEVVYEPDPSQWGTLFGSSKLAVAASNFQLKGVVVAKRGVESVAIVSYNGQPGQAVAVEAELAPGVVLKEVHADHVIVSEGGINKRVDLPPSNTLQVDTVPMPPPNVPAPAAPPSMPPPAARPLPPPTLNPIPVASLPSVMPEAPK